MVRKVDFFIVGSQKGGTTALEAFLRAHPGIQMGLKKELHFFDNEALDWNSPDHAILHSAFKPAASEVLRGEATPIYMYWPNSMERLKDYNPEAKLIVMLRHPALRAYSHWKMEMSRNNETFSFPLAISDVGRLRVSGAPRGVHRKFSYVERGFYAAQIARMLNLFRASNILFLRTDELWHAPNETLNRISRFLGIFGRGLQSVPLEYIVPLQPRIFDAMPEDSRAYLNNLYSSDVAATAEMTGLDLADWLDPHYAEPMRADLYPLKIRSAA